MSPVSHASSNVNNIMFHVHYVCSGPDGDLIRPATFSKVDAVEAAPVVQAYFTNGFLIRGTRVMGSVALLPRGMLHWRVLNYHVVYIV